MASSSLSSVLNQQHCINLPKKCSVLTLRFFSLKPCRYSSMSAARIFCIRRESGRSTTAAFSRCLSRSFSQSQSQYPASVGSKFSEIQSLHHFMPKATATVADSGVSDPQLEYVLTISCASASLISDFLCKCTWIEAF